MGRAAVAVGFAGSSVAPKDIEGIAADIAVEGIVADIAVEGTAADIAAVEAAPELASAFAEIAAAFAS